MDYLSKINEIEAELAELKNAVKSATGEREIVLNQSIIALENTRSNYIQLLLQQNAQAGNSHSI